MAAKNDWSEIYVDPSIGADSGTGTVGDPFGDLEYGIVQTLFDTTGGTRVNIKAGADEVLVSPVNVSMASTSPTAAWSTILGDPVIFEGYTTAAGDGGIGVVDCDGDQFNASSYSYFNMKNLHIKNGGTGNVVHLNQYASIIGCEFSDCDTLAIYTGSYAVIQDCYFHDINPTAIDCSSGTVSHCYFENTGTKDFVQCIDTGASGPHIRNNIFALDGASDAILANTRCSVYNNSIFAVAGTGVGIQAGASASLGLVANNIIEGFSGAGGKAVDFATSNSMIQAYYGNAIYNCTNGYTTDAPVHAHWEEDNETLTSSAFTNAASGDFTPVDEGNVKEGSIPQNVRDNV